MPPTQSFKRWLTSAGLAVVCLASSPAHATQADRQAVAELRTEVEALKAELEESLQAQAAEARKREDEVRKESAAALEAARQEAEKTAAQNLARERTEWQAANQQLQDELRVAAARVDAREQAAPPRVGAAESGLSLGGYLQSDYVVRQSSQDQLNPTSGQPLNQDRFLIRRARLLLDFNRTYGEGGLEFDGNTVKGATARLLGARASLKLPGRESGDAPLVMGSIGSFRVPFGLEVMQSDLDRPFMERSTASRAFFPSEFDLGLRVQGAWQYLRYAVAVVNGEPIDERAFPALDPNHQKDVMGRVGVNVTSASRLSVAGGVSALYGTGFHSGTLATKPVVGWIDTDGNGVYSPANETTATTGTTASPSRNFSRFAVGADVLLSATIFPEQTHLGPTALYGELIWASNLDRGIQPADPFGVLARDARELGYFAAITQAVGRHALVGFRYDFYDPDRDNYLRVAGDLVPSDSSYRSWAVMGALVSPWGRLMVQYDINRNHLGLSRAGTPGNLADNIFTVRGEARF